MHQARTQVSKKIPIPRKGTQFVAKASSHKNDAVPVVVAIRDMLGLARRAKEVKEMINNKSLKINGKDVKELRESIKLFNTLSADKEYSLTLLPTGRFAFVETKAKDRPCKILNKTMLKGKKMQLNLHDGTNIITNDKVNVQDTIYLDDKRKITKHVKFDKGQKCFVMGGKYVGQEGTIKEEKNGIVIVDIDKKPHNLNKKNVIAL